MTDIDRDIFFSTHQEAGDMFSSWSKNAWDIMGHHGASWDIHDCSTSHLSEPQPRDAENQGQMAVLWTSCEASGVPFGQRGAVVDLDGPEDYI
jgi:hypothetical protein